MCKMLITDELLAEAKSAMPLATRRTSYLLRSRKHHGPADEYQRFLKGDHQEMFYRQVATSTCRK